METGPLVISEEYLEQAHKRERRSFRVAVFWGLAVALLVGGIIFSLWRDFAQDDDIGDIRIETSACRVAPEGIECRIGHANSVLLTTPEEACFILAQGGYRCRPPSAEAEEKAADLRRSVDAQPAPELPEAPERDRKVLPELSGQTDPSAVAAPRPEAPASSIPKLLPKPAPKPTPPASAPPAAPSPSTPSAPTVGRPLVDNPLRPAVDLCVNALGVRVIC